jgi:hypothetical protein
VLLLKDHSIFGGESDDQVAAKDGKTCCFNTDLGVCPSGVGIFGPKDSRVHCLRGVVLSAGRYQGCQVLFLC